MHLGTKIREVLYSIGFSILVHRSLGFGLWNMKLIVLVAPVLVTKIALDLINHHLIHLTLLNPSVKLLLSVIFFSQLIMMIGIILTIEKFYY